MAEPIFRELQQKLDLYSLGFPATSSGVEIKILEKLFSLSDAELFLKLSPKLELPEEIALKANMSVDQAVKILSMAHDQGLVTQPATSQNPSGMCNCCGDCCGPLTSLKHHPKPAELVFSNYQAIVDPAECTGCETCLNRCQMEAIDLDQDMIALINLDRCIGCGLCVTTCPTEAIGLNPKDDKDLKTPPETTFKQMMNMAKKRKII
jgi:ferredoxin